MGKTSLDDGTQLSKENSETRVRIRWVVLKVLLDAWQLFTTVINPQSQGWRINADGMGWKAVSVLNFTWLADLGYGAYLAVLYSMVALLAVNVAMCVWVAWCFKEQKFPVVWPIKVLRIFSGVFFQAFDVASLNLLQAPNLVAWVNYLKAGVSITILWCSSMLMLLVFHSSDDQHTRERWAQRVTLAMLAGLGPAFFAGMLISWAAIRRMTDTALKALANAVPNCKLEDVCENLDSPRDVEIVARCCRVWKDRYTVDTEAIGKAHQVIKAGLAMFPKSAYMVLVHANFMIDVLGVSQSGGRRVQDARKLHPGMMCRFIMFVRQQQATQKAAGNSANDGVNMDLLGYVEYQRKQAQNAYRMVLESYSNNPNLVRLYGKFLLTIKNDPSEYFTEADRLDEMKNGDGSGPVLPDGTLEGKPLSALLAPHCNRWLAAQMAAMCAEPGAIPAAVASSVGEGNQAGHHESVLVGMHCERVAFPVRLSLSRASGTGEDSTIIALLEPIPPVKGMASLWVTANGTIAACDPPFAVTFGLMTLAKESPSNDSVLPCSVAHKYDNVPIVCTVRLSTKEAQDTPVHELRIALVDPDPAQLLVVTNNGTIVHASPDLAAWLKDTAGLTDRRSGGAGGCANRGAELFAGRGVLGTALSSADVLAGYTFSDFLPSPWKDMHTRFLRDTTVMTAPSQRPNSCRKGGPSGPTLEMRTAAGKPLYMRVAVTTSDISGELMHAVRMAGSSVENALAERRLRLRVAQDGLVAAVVDGSLKHLFGLDQGQVIGRPLWEIIDGLTPAAGEPLTSHGLLMLGSIVSRMSVGVSMGAATRKAMAKPAVLQVHVETPEDDNCESVPVVYADLWPTASISGVLELDGLGRVTGVLEETLRPVGLLFGLPGQALLGSMFADLVTMPPDRKGPSELLTLKGDKKSSLKSDKKDVNVKVGPVHVLQGLHSDGRPLALDVQVVGKPLPRHPLTVVLRTHVAPMVPGPKRTTLAASATGARGRVAPAPEAGQRMVTITETGLRLMPVTDNGLRAAPAAARLAAAGPHTAAGSAAGRAAEAIFSNPVFGKDATGVAGKPEILPAAAAVAVLGDSEQHPLRISGVDIALAMPPPPSRKPSVSPDEADSASAPAPPLLDISERAAKRSVSISKVATPPGITSPRPTVSLDSLPVQTSGLIAVVGSVIAEPCAAANGGSQSGSVATGAAPGGGGVTTPRQVSYTVLGDLLKEVRNVGSAGSDGDRLRAGVPSRLTPPLAEASPKPPPRQPTLPGATPATLKGYLGPGGAKSLPSPIDDGAYYQNSVCPSEKSDEEQSKGSDGAETEAGQTRQPSPEAKLLHNKSFVRPRNHAEAELAGPMAQNNAMHKSQTHEFEAEGQEEDAPSEAGHSSASALSGAGGAEYKRGKRFKKLVKMMDSSHAQQVSRRFQLHALITVALLTAVHTICFSLTIRAIDSQRSSMVQLGHSGQAQRYMHQAFVKRISDNAEEMKGLFNEIHEVHHASTAAINLLYYAHYPVWEGKYANGSDRFINVTVWILDALLFVAVDSTHWVDTLQLIFLAVEGALVSCVAACYLAYLLRAVAAQRYKLYSLFLVIPVDDDEEDEEEEKPQQQQQQESLDDDAVSGEEGGVAKIKRRATLKLDDEAPLTAVGGGSAAASPLTAGGVASSRDVNGAVEGTADGRYGRRTLPYDDKYDKPSAGGMGGKLVRCWSWAQWRVRRLLRGSTKRRLRTTSKETVIILLPFLVWSALVIAIYAVAVVHMQGVISMVAVHSVVNFMAARTYRSVFFAQELAVTEDPSLIPAKRASVATCLKLVKDAWYTLQLGDNAFKAAGPDAEHFPMVKQGLAYASNKLREIFYDNGRCHRTQAHQPCPGPEYRFYQIIRTGLDSIMQQFMISLDTMATREGTQPEGMGTEEFDFIYTVGSKDLSDGTVLIADEHYKTLSNTFTNILVLHVLLFLFLFVIFLGFLFLLLNPLIKRISKERRHIAELMSQLPLELDVEKLVARALGTAVVSSSSQQQGGGAGATTADQGGANSDAASFPPDAKDDTKEDGTSKWKAIIRAASSLNGKQAPPGGLNRRRAPVTGPY
ncbi:hypothetical protein GPECTOR_52g63 [Gonium pectorale]|uniref:TmcB/TmcC TPR repeats domain-containing protein n=1 Tax=Gonium pectorale TaxID=33097 RepID=A0A150G7Y6_GONPE|nr:hypothetical protein GPECTOR_52g63 [Gonium pectorale]|eukprot:KXZ45665.1 hypothetical protein GPECTOR_52g63 [Gonium pectorale]